jgi:hypothetical protein
VPAQHPVKHATVREGPRSGDPPRPGSPGRARPDLPAHAGPAGTRSCCSCTVRRVWAPPYEAAGSSGAGVVGGLRRGGRRRSRRGGGRRGTGAGRLVPVARSGRP